MRKVVIGKTFAERVRDVVRAIPRGKTMSYGDVARKAGVSGAARAVGTIMKNNFDKTVPCHRVIRADGRVGEYNRGGPVKKRALLKAEGVLIGLVIAASFMFGGSTLHAQTQDTVQPALIPQPVILPKVVIPQAWLDGFLAPIESWRVAQASHLATLRDADAKVVLTTGIKDIKDNLLAPDQPTNSQTTTPAPDERHGFEYVRYIGLSALAAFFAHQFLFYVAIVLIVLLLLRLLLRGFL